MIRYTCDLCGKDLHPQDDERFIIKVEAFAARDPGELTDDDLEDDHLEQVSQILQEEEGYADLPAPTQYFRFDLCGACHCRFARDPLGKKQQFSLFTSEN